MTTLQTVQWLSHRLQNGGKTGFRQVKEISVFSKTFRWALGLIQSYIQWVLGTPSPGERLPGSEAGHLLLYTAGDKKHWSYNSTPPYAFMTCTGKNLPLCFIMCFSRTFFFTFVNVKLYHSFIRNVSILQRAKTTKSTGTLAIMVTNSIWRNVQKRHDTSFPTFGFCLQFHVLIVVISLENDTPLREPKGQRILLNIRSHVSYTGRK